MRRRPPRTPGPVLGAVKAPKELQALQDEIDALHRRQSTLEDHVLELMEQVEPLDA